MFSNCLVSCTRDVPQGWSAEESGVGWDLGICRNASNGSKLTEQGQRFGSMLNQGLLSDVLQLQSLSCKNGGSSKCLHVLQAMC